jgi:response regulator RpfG family c-di-GMP phosphodiesterase
MPRNEVVSYISEKSGSLFDPNLVRAFLHVVQNEAVDA